MHVLRKLRAAAEAHGSPSAASVVARVALHVLYVNIVHGQRSVNMAGNPVNGGEFDCVWHLSMDEHEEVYCGVLLPLALMHATPVLLEQGMWCGYTICCAVMGCICKGYPPSM